MIKHYTDEELIKDLYRFIDKNERIPRFEDMLVCNGYISRIYYIKRYGSWSNALEMCIYTNEFLISELQRFYKENGRSPFSYEFLKKNNYPSSYIYYKRFGTWNNALKEAKLELNKHHTHLNGNEICSICGSSKTNNWTFINELRICSKCFRSKRDFIHGILDINSTTGIGYISEYIINNVINNIYWINNNIDTFNNAYDMHHDKYGYINVKSSLLHNTHNSQNWSFCLKESNKIPDTYIFIAFNENKSKVNHIWFIPKTENIVHKQTLKITNSKIGLERVKQYEVDVIPYNNVLQKLNIYDLFPFRNLDISEEVSV